MKVLSIPDIIDLAFDCPGHVDLSLGITVYTHILQNKDIKIDTLALTKTT